MMMMNLKDHAHSFPVIKDLHSWWFGNRNVSSDGTLKTSESVCRVNNRHDLNLKRKKRGVDDDFRLSDLFYSGKKFTKTFLTIKNF